MKVLQGYLKNRPILVPKGIRPVTVRVKEAILDILAEVIEGAAVLDLFAGSGALGIETLSGGARSVVFVDRDPGVCGAVRRNLKNIRKEAQAVVYTHEAQAALQRFQATKKQFDIVFIDPPYCQGLTRKTLHTIDEYDIVTPHGFVVITCFYKDIFDFQLRNFQHTIKKSYGQTVLLIYQNSYEQSDLSGDL